MHYLWITLLSLLLPINAYACACCATAKTWYSATETLEPWVKEDITKLSFAPSVTVFQSTLMDDEAQSPMDDDGSLRTTVNQKGDRWQFTFTGKQQKQTSISFTLPSRAHAFKVDTHLNREPTHDISLYKELRFQTTATVSGFLGKPTHQQPIDATLILQGHGNTCASPEDYRVWRLKLTQGDQVLLEVYGKVSNK